MNQNIDLVLSYYKESNLKLRKIIKRNDYDVILDLHNNFRSRLSTFFLRPKIFRYKKQYFKKFMLVKFKINLFHEVIPVYQKYINSCSKYLNLYDKSFKPTELIFFTDRLIKDKYIVVAPSSRHFTKTFPEYKFAEIIKSVKKKIVLISGKVKSETDVCKRLSALSKNSINYGGKLKYEAVANVIYNAELVICNDSGILHLAEALGKKVIVIFGSSVREFGFYPQLSSTIIFENNNLKCRPCSHIGRKYCPEKHFNCMEDINVYKIIELINKEGN